MTDIDKLIGFMAIMQAPFMNDPDVSIYLEKVKATLKELTAQKWISVKDRLPEEEVRVLVWGTQQGFAYCDQLINGVWIIGAKYGAIISHWMPIPEPPKEG